MKTVPLQLVTVNLENGKRGVFVGVPLVEDLKQPSESQVEDIWFSNVQEVPDEITLIQLLKLIRMSICRCEATLQ